MVTSNRIMLGPFELLEPIGRGGMADVWKGVHPADNVAVAVKIMTGEHADNPAYRTSFRNEVRAVAGLTHPNVVVIYDDGTVSSDAQWLSKGRLRRGAPFIAMEYMAGGTLAQVLPDLGWVQVRRVLALLLDALSHAHARGVIHLDLKPDNVLLPEDHDLDALKLTDFGIAHAMGRHGADMLAAGSTGAPTNTGNGEELEPAVPMMGTPVYMAPEQFAAQWRDFGPWTDLYALGCVAYEMVCGKPPFERANALQLAEAHWYAPPPPLEPRFEIPAGFAAWVMRLLQKRPCDRFQFAADATYALSQMEEVADTDDTIIEDLAGDIVAIETVHPEEGSSAASLVSDARSRRSPSDRRGISRLITESIRPAPTIESLWFGSTAAEIGGAHEEEGRAGRKAEGPSPTPAPPARGHRTDSLLDGVQHQRLGADTEEALENITLAAGERVSSDSGLPYELPPIQVPPLPESWRPHVEPHRSMLLEGAGLGLYGIRTIPFVDRDGERDAIWQALHEVHEARRPAVVLVRGAAVTGKSRLAEWMTERALEAGGARVLTARHGPTQSPAHGLPAMLARFTRCVGLSKHDTEKRLERLLANLDVSDPYEWQAMTELMTPALLGHDEEDDGPAGQTIRFHSPTERYVIITRYLEKLSAERPVIVWLDDAQWGGDSLRFVYHVMKHTEPEGLGVLFLITVQDDALVERPYESGLLDALKNQPGARGLFVPPLAPEDHSRLVRELLGLEPRLASRVEARTAGNPMFAVQLVGDWVQRGLLEPGGKGFVLKQGVPLTLPDDIHQVWKARIQRVMQGQSPTALHAIELAATLGQSVLVDEWRAACLEAGISFPERVLDSLLGHRLVRISLGKRSGRAPKQILWSFVHAMLRESLERSAREGGRARRHHLACANMLKKRYEGAKPGVAERIGRHYLAASEFERALDPLLRAAEQRREASDFHAARVLIQRREEAIRALGGDGLDVRLGDGWLLAAQMDLDQEHPEAVARHIARIEKTARRHEWQRIQASAKRLKGDLARYRGDYSAADRLYQEALPKLALRHEARETAHCLRGLANVAWEQGRSQRTVELYERALELYEKEGDSYRQVSCLVFLGHVAQQMGEASKARACFEKAMELGRKHGHLSGVSDALRGQGRVALYDDRDTDKALGFLRRAKTIIDRIGGKHAIVFFLNEAGELARRQGDLDRAARAYQKAMEKARDTEAGMWAVPTVNLATVLMLQGRFDDARPLLQGVPERLERHGHRRVLGAFHAALAWCHAEERSWEDFDRHLEAAGRHLAQVGVVKEVDIWMLSKAEDLCRSAGEDDRARRVRELEASLCQALDWPAEPREFEPIVAGHTL